MHGEEERGCDWGGEDGDFDGKGPYIWCISGGGTAAVPQGGVVEFKLNESGLTWEEHEHESPRNWFLDESSVW